MSSFNLPNYGFLKFSGPDAAKFLQGQVTCDLNQLSTSRSLRGAICNLKGRVVADFRLVAAGEDIILQTQQSMVSVIKATLEKYAVFSKVTISDCAEQVYASGFLDLPPEGAAAPTEPGDVHPLENGLMLRVEGTRPRYEAWYFGATPDSQQDPAGLAPAEWLREDILAGLYHVTPEASEQHTPQALNYDLAGLVSFEKGCYTGQEIVARLHFRGTSKQRLFLAESPGPATPQSVVIEADPGESAPKSYPVLATAEKDGGGCVSLAVLPVDLVESGTALKLADDDNSRLQFLSLPYTD